MKKLTLVIIATITILTSCKKATTDNDWLIKNYTKREVQIPMRDGVKLFTAIYEPKDNSTKHPILLNRTCYSIAPYGPDFAPLMYEGDKEYIKNKYIIVYQDVRGKNHSEGIFADIRPFISDKTDGNGNIDPSKTDEASDAYDTAEWLINNTNNNGNIGVHGISYPGFYSTMAALSGHPAIKAVSPQAPVTDWFRGDDVHHNGALFLADMFGFDFWFQYLQTDDIRNGEVSSSDIPNPSSVLHTDQYSDFLRIGCVKNFTELMGDSVTMWNNVIEHPDLDDWWEERNVAYHLKDIKPAILVVGGLFDAEDCYGTFETYKTIRRDSPSTEAYLVEGPWAHGAWRAGQTPFFGDIYFGNEIVTEYYSKNIEYPFFAYYLEGKGEKPSYRAKVFDTGSCQWETYDNEWPMEATTPVPFYLSSNGSITTENNDAVVSAKYTSDPSHPVPYQMVPRASRETQYMLEDQRFASQRPDVATFQTEALEDMLKVSGEIVVNLNTSISTTDADFIVKIIDVFPDDFEYPDSLYTYDNGFYEYTIPPMAGYQMLVRGDVIRGKYRDNLRTPKPFTPNQKTTVSFKMPDINHTFLPGHKLMIQVQSTWFPLVDRNPQKFCNIYKCSDDDFQKADITIYSTSNVVLPVVNNN